MPNAAAIYFSPEAYTISGPKLMGRNAAGESFLRGYIEHAQADAFWALVLETKHGRQFEQTVRSAGRPEPVHCFSPTALNELENPGVLYIPAPGIGESAWQRSFYGSASWSLCGITHTTASARVMDCIAELLTAPVQPWDALICTSTVVRDTVQTVLGAQAAYLKRRTGATRFTLPKLPLIPLGIHTDDFACDETRRARARAALGAKPATLVVLFMGRLSFHAKAHPLAMYQALERAARGRDILLVECGWHANKHIADAFAQAARAACPSVRTLTLDGRRAEMRQRAWAGADVFCSLSDNVQETFGLTPIEAMAAGLPVVVSDWNGYRDTVRDGIDGFCVPTVMPGAGHGAFFAKRHALGTDTYDAYCGLTAAFVAVDVEETAKAFERLFDSRALRVQMGAAGRARARELYDWSRIIPRYESLWAELTEERRRHPGAGRRSKAAPPWPARMDPFAAFKSYPTRTLSADTELCLAGPDAARLLEQWRALRMVDYAQAVLPSDDDCGRIIQKLKAGPCPASKLVAEFPPERRAVVFRGLLWMIKMGALRVS